MLQAVRACWEELHLKAERAAMAEQSVIMSCRCGATSSSTTCNADASCVVSTLPPRESSVALQPGLQLKIIVAPPTASLTEYHSFIATETAATGKAPTVIHVPVALPSVLGRYLLDLVIPHRNNDACRIILVSRHNMRDAAAGFDQWTAFARMQDMIERNLSSEEPSAIDNPLLNSFTELNELTILFELPVDCITLQDIRIAHVAALVNPKPVQGFTATQQQQFLTTAPAAHRDLVQQLNSINLNANPLEAAGSRTAQDAEDFTSVLWALMCLVAAWAPFTSGQSIAQSIALIPGHL